MTNPGLITEDFLLETDQARELYHAHAERMPILDYHCHLAPAEVARDERFETITRLWLGGDHYKWRALRANGVAERFITGEASDWEKFEQWAATMPRLLRNPLYHWTHLELKRTFDVDELLSPATARAIYERCNAALARPDFSARGLIRRSNVALLCTTDDPADSLEHHRRFAAEGDAAGFQMLPAWRPDAGMAIESSADFNAWLDRLAEAADIKIRDFSSYLEALNKRHAFFHAQGCRLSDHGLEQAYAESSGPGEVAAIFAQARRGIEPTPAEAIKFKSAMLYEFGVMDHARGWVQQYHLGPLRNASSRLLAALGRDSGGDAMGDGAQVRPLARLFDRLDREGHLAKTIVYNSNPADTYPLAALLGCFQDGSVPGKMQLGSGWWFLDQRQGMRWQIEALSQLGLLSRFVGMLTDSRSFLSYPRHEYFRRILCNILGRDMARGLIPRDMALVGSMVRDISYNNAARYFGFSVPVEEN